MECKDQNARTRTGGSLVLIETLWNVKRFVPPDPAVTDTGFNRNIVECKVLLFTTVVAGLSGFNRNIVECKVWNCKHQGFPVRVLIETLWNVKSMRSWLYASGVYCFNRNIVECKEAVRWLLCVLRMCFNRNIVECKDTHSRHIRKFNLVLIETLWNVKRLLSVRRTCLPRFNRNIVECKVSFVGYGIQSCDRFNRNIVECKGVLE